MRPSKEHAPYSLYKKQTRSGRFWYVRFWDENTKKYTVVRSTGIQVEGKRERRREADDMARILYEELQQCKANPDISNEPPLALVLEQSKLQPQGDASKPFIQYLLDFWSPDSEYANYKRGVKKRPLSAYYIQMNHDDVVRHIASFTDFHGITLGEVSRKLIKKWLIWMAGKKVVHIKKDGTRIEGNLLSGRRINSILQGMRVAVRWAVDNEELPADPFRKLDEATVEEHEKGIITQVELNKLIATPIKDPYSRAAVLLAARCGMRLGEVRGLKWGDIKNDDCLIIIQNNFVNGDGLKSPKIKGGTLVKNSSPVPLPSDVENVLNLAKELSNFTADSDFVLQSSIHEGEVVSKEYFRSALKRELRSIGIDAKTQKDRNITFHSLRHSYITLGRISGLNAFEIQTLARHKSAGMMERYSHGKQAIDFTEARKKLEGSVKGDDSLLKKDA